MRSSSNIKPNIKVTTSYYGDWQIVESRFFESLRETKILVRKLDEFENLQCSTEEKETTFVLGVARRVREIVIPLYLSCK